MSGLAGIFLTATLATAQIGGEANPWSPPAAWARSEQGLYPAATHYADAIPYPDGSLFPETEGFETFADETTDDLPGTRFTVGWLSTDGAGGFGTFDVDANHAWLLGYDDWPPVTITPGFGIHFWSGPEDIDLPPRVYDVYLDLQWRPIERDRWGLSLGVVPGWYGDFEVFDSKTFQLTGWLLGNYRFNERWNLAGGVAYVRQLQNNVLPVGGLIWTPNEDMRWELLVPKPRVARRIRVHETGSTWLYVAGQLGGGTWAVAETPQSNVHVAYNDLRLLLGLETFRYGGLEASLEAGYVFSRDIVVDGFIVHSPGDTVLVQMSFAF